MNPELTTLALCLAGLLILSVLLRQARRGGVPSGPARAAWPAAPSTPAGTTPVPQEPAPRARHFRDALDQALLRGERHLGGQAVVDLTPQTLHQPWPLREAERRSGLTRRLWRVQGDCHLPHAMRFNGEVLAHGQIVTAPGGLYHALMAGSRLHLARRCHLHTWGHAGQVDIEGGARLWGTVSADHAMLVAAGVEFHHLSAPVLRFTGDWWPAGTALAGAVVAPDEQEGVSWDPVARRGDAWRSARFAPLRSWQGSLFGRGDLSLGEGSEVHGHLRARGELTLKAGTVVHGNVLAAGEIFLAPGCRVSGHLISETAVHIAEGCVIGHGERSTTVRAPRVDIDPGAVVLGEVWSGSRRMPPRALPDRLPASADGLQAADPEVRRLGALVGPWWLDLPAAPWQASQAGQRLLVAGSLDIPPLHAWQGELEVRGDLGIGAGSRCLGAVRADGDLQIAAGALMLGDLHCGRTLQLAAGSRIGGSMHAGSAIHIGPGCTLGTPDQPVRISAPVVSIAQGVVLHGEVIATDSGRTVGTLADPLPPEPQAQESLWADTALMESED